MQNRKEECELNSATFKHRANVQGIYRVDTRNSNSEPPHPTVLFLKRVLTRCFKWWNGTTMQRLPEHTQPRKYTRVCSQVFERAQVHERLSALII